MDWQGRRACLKNCSLDCSANVRQAEQSGKDYKLKGQCVKMYEFEVCGVSGSTIVKY